MVSEMGVSPTVHVQECTLVTGNIHIGTYVCLYTCKHKHDMDKCTYICTVPKHVNVIYST